MSIQIDEKALEAAQAAGNRVAPYSLPQRAYRAAITAYLTATSSAADARIARLEDALRQISGTSSKRCPFTRGTPNNLQPEDPCPVCGDKGDFSDETTSSPSRCFGNAPSAIARAALGSDAV